MSFARPGSQALRRGRVSIVGQIYLITTTTSQRKPQFADFWAGRALVNVIRELDQAGLTTTLAFVVMPDHLHWLCELRGSDLNAIVRLLKGRSARTIQMTSARKGQFWQSGFHDHALRSDERVLDAARYIIANPVRAGIVRRVSDYALWDCVWLCGCDS